MSNNKITAGRTRSAQTVNTNRQAYYRFILDSAQDKWPWILASLGVDINFLSNTHGPCPFCDGKDRFRFDDKDGKGTFICNQCGAGDGVEFLKRHLKYTFTEVCEKVADLLQINQGSDLFNIPRNKISLTKRKIINDQDYIKAREMASTIWEKAAPADPNHPYLQEKGIKPGILRVEKDTNKLLVPMFNTDNQLQSLQFIMPEVMPKRKKFMRGCKVQGAYCFIGNTNDTIDTIYVVEGYATGASVHEATDYLTVCAFSCNNLQLVAQTIRDQFPDAKIIIAADNDQWPNSLGKVNNNGIEKAKKAAATIQAYVVYPYFDKFDISSESKDFNDLMQLAGLDEVKAQLIPTDQSPPPLTEHTMQYTPTNSEAITYRRASDIQPKPVQWLWPGRIARGKVSMIAGNPGLGKSQVTASIAAIVSTGGIFPGEHDPSEIGSIIILSAEDDPEDTICPRLHAAGANLSRICIADAVVMHNEGGNTNDSSQRSFNLKNDLTLLENMLDDISDVAMIVIDPITAYLGDTDSHKNADIRALLAPLSAMAAKHNAAVVCVSHLNKNSTGEALMRVAGSLAFVAASRAAFIVTKNPDDETQRLFLPMKNNLGNDTTGFAFRVQSAQIDSPTGIIETSSVVWQNDIVNVSINDAMGAQGNIDEHSAIDEAIEFLLSLLENQSLSVKLIKKEAEDASISFATIRRAKQRLGIKAKKCGMDGGWIWVLPNVQVKLNSDSPPKVLIGSEDAHTESLSTFSENDHLQDPSCTLSRKYHAQTNNQT